ncbi:MAG: ABC transporter substrate binding protein, partial [Pseudonocardiaceae bacterium]
VVLAVVWPTMKGRHWQSPLFFLPVILLTVLVGCGRGVRAAPPASVLTVAILRAVQSTTPENLDILIEELRVGGFVVGTNLRIVGADPTEVHSDPNDAEETVRRWGGDGLDLVIALSSSGAAAASRAAPKTDVLFLSNDPTVVGLLKDERHPEGNLTGATFRVPADRTLDLARRTLPGLQKVGLLYPTSDPASKPVTESMVKAGADLGIEVALGPFTTPDQIAPAIMDLRERGIGCLVLANAPTTVRNYPAITAALNSVALPAVSNTDAEFTIFVLEPDTRELYRQMGRQAVRLLKGTPVSLVPVEDPGLYRFILNKSVADRLGLQIPAEVLASAKVLVRP